MARGLLGLLLLLQLAGFHGPAQARPTQPDLAGLSAAIGQTVAICQHGDAPDDGGTPDACCPSCSLCHMLGGVAILPSALAVVAPVTFTVAASSPPAVRAAPRPRRVVGTSPRGPPLSV